MDKKQIDRINELAEQAALRAQYITEWRENTRAMLDGIVIQRPDGTTEPLKRKNPPIKH